MTEGLTAAGELFGVGVFAAGSQGMGMTVQLTDSVFFVEATITILNCIYIYIYTYHYISYTYVHCIYVYI